MIISRASQLGLMALLFPLLLHAQTPINLKVSGRFENVALIDILDQLAEDIPFHFLYNKAHLPHTKSTFEFQDTDLDKALNQLLSDTVLSYIFYRDYAIVIAPKQIFEQIFSADYFKALEELSSTSLKDESESNGFLVGDSLELSYSGKAKANGKVVDDLTGESIIGATIFLPELRYGAATNLFGEFEIELPVGKQAVIIQAVGYEVLNTSLLVYSNGEVIIELNKSSINLREIVIQAETQDANIENTQVSATKIDMKKLKKMPVFLGESDIVKTLQLQAGVSTVGEGASGFNVRGGEIDQNLIIQDEGFIFNPSHALGFFSTFNSDLIKDVTLYKSIMPAQFGGRLASVLDVGMRDGDFTKYKIKGGIGPITGRLTVEGPVAKNKSSLILGFRTTYSDWVLRATNNPEVSNSSSSFYDANIGYAYKFNEKNILHLSFYSSNDEFSFNKEFGFEYNTYMGQLSFERLFWERLFLKFSAVGSNYESTQFDFEGTDGSELETGVSYLKIKNHLTYTLPNRLKLDAGGSVIYYRVEPGKLIPRGQNSVIIPRSVETNKGLEWASFVNAEWDLSSLLTISGGVRYVYYQYIGSGTSFQYAPGKRPQLETIIDTLQYSKGVKIVAYSGIEPRLSFRYKIGSSSSIKGGYSRTAQYINQISNFASPTPTSSWQLSTPNIKPVRSHNFSIGYFRNFDKNLWETSLEAYFRAIDELFDYQDFAQLNANSHIETELLPGIGQSRGIELSVKKRKGKVHGWFSYTLSKTERKVEGVNDWRWYNSNFDKIHDISLVSIFQPNQRHSIAVNFNYGTGRPITAPVGIIRAEDGFIFPIYSDRNQLRIPDYHRLDISYTIGQGYNKKKKFKTSWIFSVYNVYGRKNAFSVFFKQQAFGVPEAKRFSVLGGVFPSITFNFQTI